MAYDYQAVIGTHRQNGNIKLALEQSSRIFTVIVDSKTNEDDLRQHLFFFFFFFLISTWGSWTVFPLKKIYQSYHLARPKSWLNDLYNEMIDGLPRSGNGDNFL